MILSFSRCSYRFQNRGGGGWASVQRSQGTCEADAQVCLGVEKHISSQVLHRSPPKGLGWVGLIQPRLFSVDFETSQRLEVLDRLVVSKRFDRFSSWLLLGNTFYSFAYGGSLNRYKSFFLLPWPLTLGRKTQKASSQPCESTKRKPKTEPNRMVPPCSGLNECWSSEC